MLPLVRNSLFAAFFLIPTLPVKSLPLTETEQLSMYRECRVTYSDKNKYFAKKMCGCLVQAYIHDVPPVKSAPKCLAYASSN